MTDIVQPSVATADAPVDLAKLASIGACAMAFVYPAYLGLMYRSHSWILESHGRPGVSDFLVFWLAGRSALHGAAAAAYDPHLHHAVEVAAAGHEFTRHLSWHYPPLFLFVAAALAFLPYVAAFVVWVGSTLAAFALAVSRIARSPTAFLIACATPAVFINAIGGENGPLTAALMGAALFCLEERPVLSGVFLGLLTYRPHLGIVFPLVLLAGGYWRVFISASVTAAIGILACWGAFGFETLRAFIHFFPAASDALLVNGENGFGNFETIYGLVRWSGFGGTAASVAQAGAALAATSTVIWIWRKTESYSLKAAALSVATLLATPYLYIYDFAVLTVTFAFLYRHRPFDEIEIAGIAVANVLTALFLFYPSPIGLAALAIAIVLIARRVQQDMRIDVARFLRLQPARPARKTSVYGSTTNAPEASATP
jgi:hypothetical protein